VCAVWADSDRLKAVQWLIGVVPVVEWRCSVFLSGSREAVACGRGSQPFVELIDSGLCESIGGEDECLATGDYLFLFWFSKVSVWLHMLVCPIVRIGYPNSRFRI
jgi:hypothetical protein